MTAAVPRVSNERQVSRAEVRDLFASPIGIFEWPDTDVLNAELRAAILKRYESTPSVVQSARYAWQSEHHIDRWPEGCFSELAHLIKEAAGKMAAHVAPGSETHAIDGWEIISCWANVNPPGGHSRSHNHVETGGVLSGVYYVDTGGCEPALAGRTIFEDRSGVALPTRPGIDPLSREYASAPKPGVACLFSASQRHYVEPNRGGGLRITIAFNLKHPNFAAHYYPDMRTPNWWWRNFRGLMVLKEKVPEKLVALAKFAPYLAQELGRGGNASFSRRMKTARERAEVDAGTKKRAAGRDGPLPDKRPLP